jgi:hypothetical protein
MVSKKEKKMKNLTFDELSGGLEASFEAVTSALGSFKKHLTFFDQNCIQLLLFSNFFIHNNLGLDSKHRLLEMRCC